MRKLLSLGCNLPQWLIEIAKVINSLKTEHYFVYFHPVLIALSLIFYYTGNLPSQITEAIHEVQVAGAGNGVGY